MRGVHRKWVLTALVAVLVVSVLSAGLHGETGTEATVLTTTGQTLQGGLSGLLDTLRLDVRSIAPMVGPDQAFDIPLGLVKQITIDYPRVVIEAGDRVFVGPFAAFQGIPEALSLDQGGEVVSLATAGIRAIALHGTSLHEVPREWLGDQFLTRPAVLNVKPVAGPAPEETVIAASPPASTRSAEPVGPTWEELAPAEPATNAGQGWITLLLLLGILGLVVYFFLAP
jgi:hypothetical protein